MSKCDFQIVFDHPDRTYYGGELVSGSVRIEANREFTCDAILIEHFWRTHGRGNKAQGAQRTVRLPPATFREGQTQTIPFQFTAPQGPPTYHGTYLNIDHYVKVSADIPWALDPKKEEDFILLFNGGGWNELPHPFAQTKKTMKGGWPLVGIAGVILLVAVALFNCFGLFLGLIAAFMLTAGLRNVMAQSRVGEVAFRLGATTLAPGAQLPVNVQMTPRRSFTINAITAKLVGREECVSGSGTNKSTHKHVFHEEVLTLATSLQAAAGRTMDFSGVIEIPETEAYSFHASDNAVIWSVELRIDIPLWPDWTESEVLTVRPAKEDEVVVAALVEKPTVMEEGNASQSVFVDAPIAQDAEEEEEAAPEDAVRSPNPAPAQALPGMAELAVQLLAAPRYGPERDDIVAQKAGLVFDCVIEVERVDRTFGYVPEGFRDGRTIIGKLAGTDCKVALQLAESRNAEAELLEAGRSFRTAAAPVKWDIIYERLDLRETA